MWGRVRVAGSKLALLALVWMSVADFCRRTLSIRSLRPTRLRLVLGLLVAVGVVVFPSSGVAGNKTATSKRAPSVPLTLGPVPEGKVATLAGDGHAPVGGYPAALTRTNLKSDRSKRIRETVSDPEGDSLTVAQTFPAQGYSINGVNYINCYDLPGYPPPGGPIYAGEEIGYCGLIQLYDSLTGNESTTNNTQTDALYDACGTEVDSSSYSGWHDAGESYFSGGFITSLPYTVPESGVCWGQWTLTYGFTETFNDGQQLTDSLTVTFFAYPVNPAPSSAYGVGSGDASVNNPSPCAGDPVNCTSGDLSEAFHDVSVPGRGPGLDLTRTYNSLSASTEGIFGYGWSSSYEAHLAVNGDGSVTVTEADGSQVTATPDGSGGYSVPAWSDSTLTQNSDGTWTFVRQQTTTYTFNSAGKLTAITDRNGYSTQLAYNGSGQLATVTDPSGRAIAFSYGANGLVSQVEDPAGQLTNYGYDDSGNLTSVTDPANRESQFGYDPNHLMLTMTDPNQGVTTNIYDSSGRVTQQTDPAGLITHFAYSGDNFSAAGGTTTITDPHGNVRVENFTSGVMLSETKASGTPNAGTWTYEYDRNTFGVTSVTDPDNHTTTSTYDSAGNLLSTTDALYHTTTYTYNSFNEPLTVTDPAGIATSYTYDGNGNLLSKTVTGIGGSPTATTMYSYTDGHAGDVTEVSDPAGHVTDYTYDSQGDIATATTHPAGGTNDTTVYVYDQLGRKVCEASPDASAAGVQCPAAGQPRVTGTTTWTYDADGDTTSKTNPLGKETDYGYDGDGNQTTVTDPAGNITKTSYDADSRKATVTAGYGTAAAATTSYSYDIKPGSGACSNSVSGATYCTTTTDPSSQTTVDYFNSRDEQAEQSQPSTGTSTASYDAAGNLSSLTTNGGAANYGYDAANKLTSITYSNPSTGYAAAANVGYTYDSDGNRTSMSDSSGTTSYSYDSLERLSSVTNGAGATIAYGYDLDNEVTSITYPGRSQTVNQVYDGAGRESKVTDWLSGSTNFSYDADGNLTSQSNPNSTTISSTYNAADNLLTSQDAPTSSPSNPFASFTYTYNPDSQVQSETDTGTPGPSSQSYSYDQLDRLATTTTGSYGYDASGDPTQLARANQSFNAAHQLTSQTSTVTRVGTTSAGDNGSGSTLTLTLPTGLQANDQILLAVDLPGNQSIKTTPSGYTKVGSYSSGTGASNTQLVLYRRTAVAGDASVTVTFSKTFAKAATIVVYRGVNPVTPIDVSSNGTTVSGQSVTAPSVTTTKAGDELLLALGAQSSATGSWTAPSQMTTRVAQAGGPTVNEALADQALTSPGATGSETATFSTSGSLAAALVALEPAQTTYSYDSLGDRTSIAAPGGTTTLAYDQLGRLMSYGSTSYTYDADGLRVSKKTGHNTETFTWSPPAVSGTPQLLVDGSTDYIYGPDGLPLEQINGSIAYYYLHDQIGSTRALTNSSGTPAATNTYTPYGTLTSTTGTVANPLGFAGSYTDTESGLLYLQHRYYDAAAGQFISVDPLVSQTAEPYAYVNDDPLDATDPLGLCFLGIACGVQNAVENYVVKPVTQNWRGIAQAATVVTAGLGTAACIYLTAGACAYALPEIGAATGAALYAEGGGNLTSQGFIEASAEGYVGGTVALLGPTGVAGAILVNGAWGAGQGVYDYANNEECATTGGYIAAGAKGFVEGGIPWDEIFKSIRG